MIKADNFEDKILNKNPSLLRSLSAKKSNNFNFNKIKKFKKFKTVVIIGMGGSILGSKALYSFLRHKIKKNFIFIDNLDFKLLKSVNIKKDASKFLFIIISKSGNTTETILNAGYFKNYLKKNNVIIISEKKNNSLSTLAKNKNFFFIKHNPHIGGRYSIFSEVGMVPAYLMGLNPYKIKKKLLQFYKNKKNLILSKKNTKKLYQKKIKTLVFFNYVPQLDDFLFWCQQLLAESLGKNKKGFIPVISNAPKDHHSLMQLYLDGPKKNFYTFFNVLNEKSLKINNNKILYSHRYLKNKSLAKILYSQKLAAEKVFLRKKIPFRSFEVLKRNEKTLGELFCFFILETILLGRSLNVNPFDQPSVELIKKETKQILINS